MWTMCLSGEQKFQTESLPGIRDRLLIKSLHLI